MENIMNMLIWKHSNHYWCKTRELLFWELSIDKIQIYLLVQFLIAFDVSCALFRFQKSNYFQPISSYVLNF